MENNLMINLVSLRPATEKRCSTNPHRKRALITSNLGHSPPPGHSLLGHGRDLPARHKRALIRTQICTKVRHMVNSVLLAPT
jgi:hypothetical protein